MQEDFALQPSQDIVDMLFMYELLHQCDTLASPALGETKKLRVARKLRLQKKKEEIRAILPLYKVVWFAHYRVHGLVPDLQLRKPSFPQFGEA